MSMKLEDIKSDIKPGVTLLGVPVHRCPNCWEYEVAISHSDELERVIRENYRRGMRVRFHPGLGIYCWWIDKSPHTVARSRKRKK